MTKTYDCAITHGGRFHADDVFSAALLKMVYPDIRIIRTFTVPDDAVEKQVHWYLMMADSYYSKPQKEEFFFDSGFYKYHEAYIEHPTQVFDK